jgi:hypothetical protein
MENGWLLAFLAHRREAVFFAKMLDKCCYMVYLMICNHG